MLQTLEEQINKKSNKYAIFCAIVNIINCVLACFSLALMRYVSVEKSKIDGKTIFLNRFNFLTFLICTVLFVLIGLGLIYNFRHKKTILNVILFFIIVFFLIFYVMIALKLPYFWP